MNKKQKILTVIALAVFGATIFFHYHSFEHDLSLNSIYPGIGDVRMPLFVLAVFYAGLFFLLATPRGPKS